MARLKMNWERLNREKLEQKQGIARTRGDADDLIGDSNTLPGDSGFKSHWARENALRTLTDFLKKTRRRP